MALFAEMDHALEDVPVLRKKEVLRTQAFHGGIECVIIEQHRAQDAALGFDIAGQRPFEGNFGRLIDGGAQARRFASALAISDGRFASGLRAHRIVGNICGGVNNVVRLVDCGNHTACAKAEGVPGPECPLQ
jgi:hypothetical protein